MGHITAVVWSEGELRNFTLVDEDGVELPVR